MTLDTLLGVILGAGLALIGGYAVAIWTQRRNRRAAAQPLLHELYWNFEVAYRLRKQAEGVSPEVPAFARAHMEALLRTTKIDDFRDAVWQGVSDKLGVTGTNDEYREIQWAYEGINLVRAEKEASLGVLDALVRTIGNATMRVGRIANAPRAELHDIEERLEALPFPSESAAQ